MTEQHEQTSHRRKEWTEPELAKDLGISVKKLFNDRKAGIIPYFRLGTKLVRYYRDEVIEAYRRHSGGTDGKPV